MRHEKSRFWLWLAIIILFLMVMSGCRHYGVSMHDQPTVMPPSKARPEKVTILKCYEGVCVKVYPDGTRSYEEFY